MSKIDLYFEVQAPCNKAVLNNLPHYIVPGLNLGTDVESDEEDERIVSYPYNCEQPLPFLPPSVSSNLIREGKDPLLELVRLKQNWKHEVDVHKQFYMRNHQKTDTLKKLKDFELSDNTIFHVSSRDAQFLNVVSSNPDKEFEGVYNWYYTGGCMDILNVNGNTCLVTAHGEKDDNLCIIQLHEENNWKPLKNIAATAKCSPDITICQLCGSSYGGYIGVRQHKTCHLYTVTEDLELENVIELESKFPFTGLDINPYCIGKFCTINTKRFVQEWDVPTRKSSFSLRVPNSSENVTDKWCSVVYGCNSNTIMMADRACLHLLDLREENSTKTVTLHPSQHLEMCEDISLVFQSSIKDFAWYLCTNHHVLLYDIRKNVTPLQQWTHLMSSPPLYGHSVPSQKHQEEVICIAGQYSGELISIVNRWNGHIPHSEILPFSLPNIYDRLLSAHNSGLWLDPALQHRVKLSLTGMVWLPPDHSQLKLLSRTSAGDVFSHVLNRKEVENKLMGDQLMAEDLKCLEEWEKELLKGRNSILKCSAQKSMSHVFRFMKNSKRKLPETKTKRAREQNIRLMSKKDMLRYVDFLAPRILEAWDLENIPEWSGKVIDHESSPEPISKVQIWLDSTVPVPNEND